MDAFFSIKIVALLWFCIQCTVHNILLRYSRTREVQDMFFSSVAVFCTEIVKVVFCLIMISIQDGGIVKSIQKQIIEQPKDTLKVCVPAMLYTIQNNLSYIAATHLEAATYAVISQLKIFAAVIFSIILLQRQPSSNQWFSFLMLFAGVSLVQFQTNGSSKLLKVEQDPFFGFFVTCIACLISGFAGIFLEKILKGSAPVSLWMRNLQMAVFGIPASFLATLLQDGTKIKNHGFLFGFDSIVWITVLWYGIGGLAAAICIKYSSTIAKDFATSFAIILSTIGSIYVFGFHPSLSFMFGAVLVIFSIFLYSNSSSSNTVSKMFYKKFQINVV